MYTDSTNVMLFKFLEDYLSCILTRISHFFFRGLFIIDPKGILRQITMNDLPVGRSVDETLRLVQAFQYTDTHGEVCPAGWKPGSDTVRIVYKIRGWYFGEVCPAGREPGNDTIYIVYKVGG